MLQKKLCYYPLRNILSVKELIIWASILLTLPRPYFGNFMKTPMKLQENTNKNFILVKIIIIVKPAGIILPKDFIPQLRHNYITPIQYKVRKQLDKIGEIFPSWQVLKQVNHCSPLNVNFTVVIYYHCVSVGV